MRTIVPKRQFFRIRKLCGSRLVSIKPSNSRECLALQKSKEHWLRHNRRRDFFLTLLSVTAGWCGNGQARGDAGNTAQWLATLPSSTQSTGFVFVAPARPTPVRRVNLLSLDPTTTAATQSTDVDNAESTEPAPLTQPYEPLGFAGHAIGHGPAPSIVGGGDFLPISDRWRIGVPNDYIGHSQTGAFYDPYNQNLFKGDYPILLKRDQSFLESDLFLNVDLTSDTLFEDRRLPVPSGTSTAQPSRFDFFGGGRQFFANQNFILTLEAFEGDTSFRPRDLDIRVTPVFNINYVNPQEHELVNPDARQGQDRGDGFVGFQEAFVEKHLADLSPNYDFLSTRVGIQGFTSDFRGFLFSDNEPGIRIFGNYDDNRLQYNLAWFHALEKDTNSGLNSYTLRHQDVFIANLYRQDFIFPGYTAQLSFHTNLDEGQGSHDGVPNVKLDDNGFIARPSPIGTIHADEVHAYYLGWAGDGHIGRVNISHQFYQVLGTESFNPIAGRSQTIDGQFASLELSYDQDYLRYRTSFAFASGDGNPTGGRATGFDSIFDDPNFAGGGFSFFDRQAIGLNGTGVNLVNRNSFLPDLRTSKEEGQANFVNPGLLLYNIGLDADITPKLKLITNINYLQFDNTQTLKMVLQDNKIASPIGIDYSMGLEYRPFLNNNAILTVGAAALEPLQGFEELNQNRTLYSFFTSLTLAF